MIIRIKSCEWYKIRSTNIPQSPISSLLYKNTVHQNTILKEILDGGVYGFAVVDIVPDNATKKFIDLNWLPVIRHDEIQYSDLPEWMQRPEIEKTFPRKTLVQTMHAKEILLHTKLIQWYVSNGFKVEKVNYKSINFITLQIHKFINLYYL